MERVETLYNQWLEKAKDDSDLVQDLNCMMENDEEKNDAFYKDLEFGTAGLRGVLGAGTNRMNIYTVAKASQGLAKHILKNFPEGKRSIAISYDSRIKSELFAQTAASVFAANGIKVHIYRQLMPVPCLSFAVRELKCSAGIMITASHNPAKYNGYKVYGSDGCQITSEAADSILAEIQLVDTFTGVKKTDFRQGIENKTIEYIGDDIETQFVERVKKESMLPDDADISKDVAIVYSPLNGSGLVPILRVLRETGYTNVTVVKEQENPDGNFPTCPYPNPEVHQAMKLGMEYAQKNNADLLLATDPDCDRVGIAVKNQEGEYTLLTGNQTGVLLFDYICAMAKKNGTMPKNPVLVKTIVTTDLADRIADSYGVKTVNVLTGFKYIGEQIALLESEGKEDSFVFGFEESYGYLSGSYVRDKDGVGAAFLICEMFAYYKSLGKSLLERLEEIYNTYGSTINSLYSFTFEGAKGAQKMAEIMADFKNDIASFGRVKVISTVDYNKGIDGLPKANIIKFILEGNNSVIVRPSGTEPKIKVYLTVCDEGREAALKMEEYIAQQVKGLLEYAEK